MEKRACPRGIYRHAFIFGLLIAVSITPALAQNTRPNAESPAAAQVRALNNSLLHLHGQMQQADASNARLLRGQAAALIAQRGSALSKLIQSDPRAALTFAFSPELLADLAAKFPQSTSLLESHVTITGPVQHWIADYPKSSRSGWSMKSGGQSLNLYFAGAEPWKLNPDELLQATGVVAGSRMAVESSSPVRLRSALSQGSESRGQGAPKELPRGQGWPAFAFLFSGLVLGLGGEFRVSRSQMLAWLKHFAVYALVLSLFVFSSAPGYAQNSCTTLGAQNTVVLLVNLPNGSLPAGVTQASMQDVFFASNNPGISLDGFLRGASYGQASATGNVFGPYNLTGTYTSCSDVGGAILDDAMSAAIANGVNLKNYTRLFLIFPDIFGCGWQGFAGVGSCSQAGPGGTYNLSVAYISAAYAQPRSSGVNLASHELGHNFGLLHSGTISAAKASEVLGPLSSVGTEYDLGDYWSTLGEAVIGLYPATQKISTLGWMSSPANYQTVTSSGTYTIQPLETSPAGLEVLQIQRGTGNAGYYLWVEYRQPDGNYDSTLMCDYCVGGTSDFSGALIHYQDPTMNPAHSYLPNFTPSDLTGDSPALGAGQTWADSYSNLSLTVVSATSTGLTLNVSYGTVPCTAANPSVTLSPQDPSIYAGSTASYTVAVTDNDSSACSADTFNLSSSEPGGWSNSFSPNTITLNPGQSSSLTMNLTGPSGTQPGTYAMDAVASSNSSVGTAAANITVMAAPAATVTASVGSSSYAPKNTVAMSATVLSGGAPASGVSVTFNLTRGDGSIVTNSGTTNGKGIATWNYRLSQKAPAGTYSLVAEATLNAGGGNGTQAISSPVSFTVQ